MKFYSKLSRSPRSRVESRVLRSGSKRIIRLENVDIAEQLQNRLHECMARHTAQPIPKYYCARMVYASLPNFSLINVYCRPCWAKNRRKKTKPRYLSNKFWGSYASPFPAMMARFGMRQWAYGTLYQTKFHPGRYNVVAHASRKTAMPINRRYLPNFQFWGSCTHLP